VLVAGDAPRVYLDVAGSLAVVYRTDKQVIASTPTIANWDRLDAFVAECRAIPELPANKYYPAGLTPTDQTRRLLPNHYLDLRSFKTVRHWPTKPFEPAQDLPALEREIVSTIGDNLAAVAAHHSIYAGLSSGRDSRLIAACALREGIRLRYYTFPYPEADKQGDGEIARKMATMFNLDHQMFDIPSVTQAQKDAYLFRVGYTNNAGKTRDLDVACGQACDLSQAMVIGYGGELAKARYWRLKLPETRPGPEELLAITRQAPTERNLAAMRAWAAGAPEWLSVPDLLDVLYQEMSLGSWSSPQMYGAAPFSIYFVPIAHRRVLTDFHRFPADMRQQQQLMPALIRQAFPDILNVPFWDPPPPVRHQPSLLRRGVSKLARLLRG
jgi:hypothetical protein